VVVVPLSSVNRQPDQPVLLAVAILRHAGRYLLVSAEDADGAEWTLPSAAIPPAAAGEAVLGRHVAGALGIAVSEWVPQSPQHHQEGGIAVECRVYAAHLAADDVLPLGYREVRWWSPTGGPPLVLSALAQRLFPPIADA
jgi:hypothetical protein